VVAEVTRPEPVMVEALAFPKAHTRRPAKVTLPGPMTIVDSVLDEYYRGDEKSLAMRFAALLNRKARDLAAAGADVIQFDEPCFNIYLDKVRAWGIEAREVAREGLCCTTAVHICYSYGIPRVLAWKKRNTEWGQYALTLPLLAEARDKNVLLGVIDVGTEEVESPDLVAERISKALAYVAAERHFPCTDCELVPRSRPSARRKLKALVEGARLVRGQLEAAKR